MLQLLVTFLRRLACLPQGTPHCDFHSKQVRLGFPAFRLFVLLAFSLCVQQVLKDEHSIGMEALSHGA